MRRNNRLFAIVLIAIMVMALLTGCTRDPKEYVIRIATATTGGVYYPLGNTLGQIWSKNIPGVKAAAQATAGTPQNIELMQNKEVEIAFAQNGIAYYAYTGTGTYADKKVTTFRGMLALYPNVMHVIAAKNANIKTVADFKDKKIVPGTVASATEINSREIFGAFGLNYRSETGATNLKADYVGYNEAADLMKDGHVQGAQVAGGIPTAAVMDVMASGVAELLSLGDVEIEAIVKQYPWYFPITIPAGTYPNQPNEVKTVAVSNILIVRADLDEDVVYKLTKAVYDYSADFVAGHRAAKDATLENAMKGMIIPVHPGAAKFFREKGIKIPVIN